MSKKQINTKLPASFEEAMKELSTIVAQMESGELALEASVLLYKRGSDLVQYCTKQLDVVDSQVKILQQDMLRAFSPDAASIEERE